MLPAQWRDRLDRCHHRGRRRGGPLGADLRAAGPPHRRRRDRIDGKEKTGWLFLMHARSPVNFDAAKDLLRFITCGSVDDGKSTLIGRLLHDSMLIPNDQLQALAADSARSGTTGGATDFALLVDGIEAE